MADFKLCGGARTSGDPAGVMTQGIGFPLAEVDLTASPGRISAADVTFGDPQLDNVAKALTYLLLVSRETSVTLTGGSVNAGNPYLEIGGVSTEDTGWINTGVGLIVQMTIGRVDVDTSTLELLVNGSVVQEFETTDEKVAFTGLQIPLTDLDMVSVRKKAGAASLTNVVVTMVVKQVSI